MLWIITEELLAKTEEVRVLREEIESSLNELAQM